VHDHATAGAEIAQAVGQHVAHEHGEDQPGGEGAAQQKGEEQRVNQDFVNQRIEQCAEVRALPEARGEVAVENVSDEGEPEQEQTGKIGARRCEKHTAEQGHKQRRAEKR